MFELKTIDLYDLNYTAAADYLSAFEYPWEALGKIKDMIIKIGNLLDKSEYTMFTSLRSAVAASYARFTG